MLRGRGHAEEEFSHDVHRTLPMYIENTIYHGHTIFTSCLSDKFVRSTCLVTPSTLIPVSMSDKLGQQRCGGLLLA